MTEQKINDKLLEIYNKVNYSAKHLYDFNNNTEEYNEYRSLLYLKMNEELDLIRKNLKGKWVVSEKGFRIIESGGWIEYNNSEKIRLNQTKEKLKYDLIISKIKAKTFIPVLWLGAIGGIYSLIRIGILILSLINLKEEQKPKTQNTEQSIEEHTSSSFRQNQDSLNNSNSRTDSLNTEKQLDSILKK